MKKPDKNELYQKIDDIDDRIKDIRDEKVRRFSHN